MTGQDPYNANEQRSYPLSDGSNGVDDAGMLLPDDILVDVEIAFPDALGQNAWLGAVTVTGNLATVVIIANDDGSGIVPLAVVSVASPVPYRAYPVEPLTAGVAGWVVFGGGVTRSGYSGRFSTPGQAKLLRRCVRAYPAPPVTSLRKLGRGDGLVGVVAVEAGQDIEVAAETILDGTRTVPAIVFRLAAGVGRDVFSLYAGPCAARPEAGNCLKSPIQQINSVAPDCNGNIDIDFVGVTPTAYTGGILVSLAIDMRDACGRDRLPGSHGSLQNEYHDPCSDAADTPYVDPGSSIGDDQYGCIGPYYEDFLHLAGNHGQWLDVDGGGLGTWGRPFVSGVPSTNIYPGGDNRSVKQAYSTGSRNVTAFVPANCLGFTSLPRFCEVMLRVLPGGGFANGGIVINLDGPISTGSYFQATVNVTDNTFEIWRFAEGILTVIASAPPRDTLTTSDWYKVQVSVFPASTRGHVEIVAVFSRVGDHPAANVVVSTTVADFGTHHGFYGLGTRESPCQFPYFYLSRA